MHIFRDLFIKFENGSIEDFINKVNENVNSLDSNWSRVPTEERADRDFLNNKVYHFKRGMDDKLPAAQLWISEKKKGELCIPNVIPLENGSLTCQQYNDVLTEFYDLFIKGISDGINVISTLSSGDIDILDILGDSGAKLLSSFSSNANKSTGSGHWCDRDRWFKFITVVCESETETETETEVDIELLERLLQEQGWSEENAGDLISEFEFARDLIRYMRK